MIEARALQHGTTCGISKDGLLKRHSEECISMKICRDVQPLDKPIPVLCPAAQ
jgi:hypothetical protein